MMSRRRAEPAAGHHQLHDPSWLRILRTELDKLVRDERP